MQTQGTVIKNTGSWYTVRTTDGIEYNCKVKGNFRLKGLRCTNPVAVGDKVDIDIREDQSALITKLHPRRNYIIRRASNLSKEFQILAANIDQAVLVATLKQPLTATTFIDRFLATAAAYNVPAILVINKIDLLTESDEQELLQGFKHLYTTIGYPVICISTITGEGIEQLRNQLHGKLSLLSGNSGVGKSSTINALVPHARLRIGEISDAYQTGTHTTTFSEMIDLQEAGAIIDTPGVKGFGTIDFDPRQVSHYFPEIFATSTNCRFNNCTHTHEPGCAVLEAVNNQYISQSRYNSYLSILTDENPDKYRKPQ